MNEDLATRLSRLAEPEPPSSLSAAVMARIAREAGATARPVHPRERPSWIWALPGLALVAGACLYGWITTGSMPNVPLRVGPDVSTLVPRDGLPLLMLALGLVACLAGLFAPLRTRS
jgi:hypothetical protein